MLLKFFQNWSGVLELSPFFTFLKFLKIFVFWDYLENPLRYVGVPGDKKVSTHEKKIFNEVFFDPHVFNNGGVRENLYFSMI